MTNTNKQVREIVAEKYRYGWETEVAVDTVPKGLNEDIIRRISHKKNEPGWLLDFRIRAFRAPRA